MDSGHSVSVRYNETSCLRVCRLQFDKSKIFPFSLISKLMSKKINFFFLFDFGFNSHAYIRCFYRRSFFIFSSLKSILLGSPTTHISSFLRVLWTGTLSHITCFLRLGKRVLILVFRSFFFMFPLHSLY